MILGETGATRLCFIPGEMYTQCLPSCVRTCQTPNPTNCVNTCNGAGCVCRQGLLKDEISGYCLPQHLCPA